MYIITLIIIINGNHIKTVIFTVVNINVIPVILGIIWLKLYNLWINWQYKIIKFSFKIYCVEYRLLGIYTLDVHNMVNSFISLVLEYYYEFLDIFNK